MMIDDSIRYTTRAYICIHTNTHVQTPNSAATRAYLAGGAAAEVVPADDDGVLRLELAGLHCVMRRCVGVDVRCISQVRARRGFTNEVNGSTTTT